MSERETAAAAGKNGAKIGTEPRRVEEANAVHNSGTPGNAEARPAGRPEIPTAAAQVRTTAAADPILVVDRLTLSVASGHNPVQDVSFSLGRGDSLGIVGESGSGKSLTLRAVLGLLPSGVKRTGGEVRHTVRSAMVFQDPRGALDPLCPVVKQVAEVVRYRQGKNRRDARAEALKLLGLLGLPDSLKREDRYPNQLSGGQCQRIVIALALACRPDILLCDEPTTALDVTVQRQIIDLIARLQRELGFALVFVTHNLAIAAEVCTRIAVMRQGRIVEEGPSVDVLVRPRDPYTQMLVEAVLPLPEFVSESEDRTRDSGEGGTR